MMVAVVVLMVLMVVDALWVCPWGAAGLALGMPLEAVLPDAGRTLTRRYGEGLS